MTEVTYSALATFPCPRNVLDHISAHPISRLEELLPENWKAAHNATENLPA